MHRNLHRNCQRNHQYAIAGSWDEAAIKNDLPGEGDQDQCGDYQGSPGFGPAHVDCDGSTITGVTPPNAGHYHCSSANIVQPVSVPLIHLHVILMYSISGWFRLVRRYCGLLPAGLACLPL